MGSNYVYPVSNAAACQAVNESNSIIRVQWSSNRVIVRVIVFIIGMARHQNVEAYWLLDGQAMLVAE